MKDTYILDLFFERKEEALAQVKSIYGKLIYSIAYHILRDHQDTEECENDTYLAAWNAIPPEHPHNLAAYLSGLARNIAISRLRAKNADKRGGGEVTLSLQELEECLPAPFETDTNTLADLLNRFLATLGEQERAVFVCRYWRCDAVGQIARRYGFGQSKVKMMLSRTRCKLRNFLEQEGYTHDGR
jgi:RNA polymerase sigma-70 factor (ECF subfamily)